MPEPSKAFGLAVPCKLEPQSVGLPPFPEDEELLQMKTFPYLEGKQYEFKQAFSRLTPNLDGSAELLIKTFERIEQTCCAFLNGEGGYIVCGIRDKDREIVWMTIDDCEMDKILLRIDNIFHCKSIYTTDLEDIRPENIQTKILTKNGKYLVIIKVVPTPGKKYRTHEYEYVRLNASNYAIKRDKFFRARDVNSLIYHEEMKIVAKYTYAIEEKDKKIQKLTRSLNLEIEENELLLAQRILAEKRSIERQLEMEKHTCLLRFNYGWLLNIFNY